MTFIFNIYVVNPEKSTQATRANAI